MVLAEKEQSIVMKHGDKSGQPINVTDTSLIACLCQGIAVCTVEIERLSPLRPVAFQVGRLENASTRPVILECGYDIPFANFRRECCEPLIGYLLELLSPRTTTGFKASEETGKSL